MIGSSNAGVNIGWTTLWTGSVSASRGNSTSGTATLSQTYKNFPFIYFLCCVGTTSDHKFVQRINTDWFKDRTNTTGNQYCFRQSEADMSHNIQTNPSNDTQIYIWVYSASVIGIYGAYI